MRSAVPSDWIKTCGGNDDENILANGVPFNSSTRWSTASFPTYPLPGKPQINDGSLSFGVSWISTVTLLGSDIAYQKKLFNINEAYNYFLRLDFDFFRLAFLTLFLSFLVRVFAFLFMARFLFAAFLTLVFIL